MSSRGTCIIRCLPCFISCILTTATATAESKFEQLRQENERLKASQRPEAFHECFSNCLDDSEGTTWRDYLSSEAKTTTCSYACKFNLGSLIDMAPVLTHAQVTSRLGSGEIEAVAKFPLAQVDALGNFTNCADLMKAFDQVQASDGKQALWDHKFATCSGSFDATLDAKEWELAQDIYKISISMETGLTNVTVTTAKEPSDTAQDAEQQTRFSATTFTWHDNNNGYTFKERHNLFGCEGWTELHGENAPGNGNLEWSNGNASLNTTFNTEIVEHVNFHGNFTDCSSVTKILLSNDSLVKQFRVCLLAGAHCIIPPDVDHLDECLALGVAEVTFKLFRTTSERIHLQAKFGAQGGSVLVTLVSKSTGENASLYNATITRSGRKCTLYLHTMTASAIFSHLPSEFLPLVVELVVYFGYLLASMAFKEANEAFKVTFWAVKQTASFIARAIIPAIYASVRPQVVFLLKEIQQMIPGFWAIAEAASSIAWPTTSAISDPVVFSLIMSIMSIL